MVYNLDYVRSLSDDQLRIGISELLGWEKIDYAQCSPLIMSNLYSYPDTCYKFTEDLNVVNSHVLNQDGPFQCEFVRVLYLLIGHHDHMEVEAVLARPRIRAEALYLTLINKGNK